MNRGTGGNRFIDADAGIPDLMRVIHEGLYELAEYDADRPLDLARITIETSRIPSGRISVEVAADLTARTETAPVPVAAPDEGGQFDQCRHGEPEAACPSCAACAACNGSCGTCPYAAPPPPGPTGGGDPWTRGGRT